MISMVRWLALLPLLFVAFPDPPAREGDKLKVLTTTTDIREIAARIGGNRVEMKSFLRGPEDPHFAEARPSFIKMANEADMLLRNGMSLELGYEPLIVVESRNPKIQTGAFGNVDVSVQAEKLEVPLMAVDRSQGDVHPEGNPHYLLDPMNSKRVAGTIRDAFVKNAPQFKSEFDTNYTQFCRSIDVAMFGEKILQRFSAGTLSDLMAAGKLPEFLKSRKAESEIGGWAGIMLKHVGKPVVVFHRNFSYFIYRFNLAEAAALEPRPGIAPSSSHLSKVIDIMKERKVKAVFYNVFQAAKAVERVTAETGATGVLFAHQVNAIEGTPDYIAMMDSIVKGADAALSKP